ncbi:MAG: hypothetical protein GEEBNDBF_02560 [bacterium]|nr:hypothetical protein [bacterium]
MRYFVPSLAATLALVALGCGGSGAQSPLAPVNPALPAASPVVPDTINSVQAGLGGVAAYGGITESTLAIYTLDIDPVSLSATASLKATRAAAANDDLYNLSIDSFLRADSLKIKSISATAETVDLTYTIEHPFPQASDPAGTPNGSTNRADLGIAGRVLFLADVPSASGNTFFDDGTDAVVANTDLVANADAYYTPAGLLELTGTANTFPYKLLVDESGDGSRVGVSNGGDPTGNFGTDGWTRDELSSGWTGFGVLHQGQISQGTVALRRSALSGGFSLDVAVLAKYNDPRGGQTPGQKKANRLPSAAPDASLFAYRMPHGALDVEALSFVGQTDEFWTDLVSASTLDFMVTDWDARGIETAAADLSEDADFTTVAVGESGAPSLAVCIPGVLGDATVIDVWDVVGTLVDDDTLRGGDPGQDSGRPGDSLYYTKTVSKNAVGSQADGTYRGMLRAVDVEDALDPALAFSLDGNLGLLTSNLPRPVTYQAFDVEMITPNDPPVATFSLASSPILSATGATILALTYSDADGDNITVDIDWNGDGDFLDAGEAAAMVLPGTGGAPVPVNSPANYNNADLVDDVINIGVRFSDGFIGTPISAGTLPLMVGPNRPPQVSGAPALNLTQAQIPATLSLTAGTITATDPEGDVISFVATASMAPNGPFGPVSALPLSGIGPFNTPGTVNITLYARDANHQNLTPAQPDSAVAYPVQSADLQVCPVAPLTASNITTVWDSLNRQTDSLTNSQWGWLDFGGVTFPNTGENGAVVVTDTDSGGAPYFPFLTQHFQRLTAPATGAPVKANMTNFAGAYVIDATTGRDFINLMPHQIEVDPLGRVLFLTRHAADDYRAIGGNGAGGTNTGIYEVNGNIHTDVKFFDYDFDTSPIVTALTGTITTTEAPVAMAIDPRGPDYAVWTLDALHVLRKYVRNGATAYTAVPSATMDISTIIGANTGTGDTNRKVHDFVINAHNGAFYVLVQSRAAAAAPGNGYVYRIECDGTYNSNLVGPNTNPRQMTLNTSITQNIGADILIDQHNASGTLLTGPQDAQLVVVSYNNQGSEPELRILNANLEITASLNNNRRMHTGTISYNNGFFTKGNNNYTQWDYYRYPGAPAGWQ